MELAEPRIEAALPETDRVAEVKARLVEAGVKYVLSCWIDLYGLPKTKPIPISRFEELCAGRGPQFAVHSVSMAPELGPADPDQIPIPDLDAVYVCPWDPTQAIVFADLYWEGAPYAVCPRSALKRQVRHAHEIGYRVMVGVEPEFILMRLDEDGTLAKAYEEPGRAADLLHPAFGYDADYSIQTMPFLGEMIDILEDLDWGIADVVCEGAYSQFELDFGYTDVVGMADRFVFLRLLIKQVARKHRFFATFMPKPTKGDWRSGGHINHSMQPVDQDGVNVFGAPGQGWQDTAYQVVAGLLNHARALTALACPTVNSYAGLVPRVAGFEGGTVTWAPTHATYGKNNRSAMLRLPQGRFSIENRAADMCQNPYLSLAFTMAASLEGIAKQLDPGPPLEIATYDLTPEDEESRGIRRLPRTLLEAIEAFDKDGLAKDVLGPTMHRSYSLLKHEEWERFHQSVTEWEQTEYLQFY